MTDRPTITVIGSLNLDFVAYTSRCPGPGETLTGSSLSVNAGGKGANQAVACARAGFTSSTDHDVTVNLIGAVGAKDPYYSTLLRPTLEQSGVITTGIRETAGASTGSASITVEEGGENRIIVIPGANHDGMRDVETILGAVTESAAMPQVVVLQGEIPRDTLTELLHYFNDPSCRSQVILNIAPVYPEGIPIRALRGTAVLIMNETEAVQMARALPDVSCDGLSEANLDPEALAPLFHRIANVGIVIITLGAKGAFLSTATGRQRFVPSVPVKNVRDTTAAGDTFVGYLSAALAKHAAQSASLGEFDCIIESSVRVANRAAALCVQRMGAIESIPFGYEVLDSYRQ
ncbi:Ribokinase-like protein [Aspergillus avenaceus]|uniref:Ribokinase n=1 Tax=Aspergillus avenaceus TaxID=36643 RepID=A0A5N6TLD4_ASPAV|nr:Ribokinase-like protein [Aspergillus avenaceus]